MRVLQIFTLLLTSASVCSAVVNIIDFGAKLPDLIQEHPDKSWLVKFYAPWCYHCQQLGKRSRLTVFLKALYQLIVNSTNNCLHLTFPHIEPAFVNVAERLHNNHDNLVVGRVDCTKSEHICENYKVQSYPTIIYLNKNARVPYKGDRSVQSLVDFAERLNGPDVKTVYDCETLKRNTDQHGLVVLSTEKNDTSDLNQQFESLASSMKSHYWFYRFRNKCKNFIDQEGIYILKRHLDRSIKYQPISSGSLENPTKSMVEWLVDNSFPVYSPLSSMNFERILSSDKLIAIAVLDEYKPAKKFSQPSAKFHQSFERLAKKFAQIDDKFLFVWSSDLDLIQSIAIGTVLVPNLMLLKPDLKYHLLIENPEDLVAEESEVPHKLRDENIKALIASAKTGGPDFKGGDSYLYKILRYIYTQFKRFITMYRGNPLLASILIGLPSIIVLFVIYTTCCYDGPTGDDRYDEDDYFEDEERSLLNHAKQD